MNQVYGNTIFHRHMFFNKVSETLSPLMYKTVMYIIDGIMIGRRIVLILLRIYPMLIFCCNLFNSRPYPDMKKNIETTIAPRFLKSYRIL